MFRKIVKKLTLLPASAVLLTSSIALGVTIPGEVAEGDTVEASWYTGTISDVINNALNIILGIAGLIALFYIIAGGFSYLTSQGNPEKVTTAKNQIVYAFVGVIIIALAFALKSYIFTTLLGADYGGSIDTTL